MLTVQLAAELRDSCIKVNSVDPGYTATDLNGHRGRPDDTGGSSRGYPFGASAGPSLTGNAEVGRALIAEVASEDRVLCCSDRKLRTYKEFKCNLKLR
jgi:NAD(P)-dependent dehydrogenase (short-subunit alcohol dehydrogenase family)